jgi:predicted peroxiredoxin
MDNDYSCVQALITSGSYEEIVFQNVKVIGGEPLQKEFARDIISWLKKMDNPPLILLKLNIPNMEYYKDGSFFPKEDLKENEQVKAFHEMLKKIKLYGVEIQVTLTTSYMKNENIPEDVKSSIKILCNH